jgi:simple sugar transport system ATP-binding protein
MTANDARSDAPVLEAVDVWKYFGPTVALAGVSLQVRAQRILALLGDNGAGKSTLIKILCGVFPPDKGQMYMYGQPVRFANPNDARQRGIATCFQDLAVCPLLSITRNVVLGNEPVKGWGPFRRFDVAAATDHTAQALRSLGVKFSRSLDEQAVTLSGGERQALAIARAMFYGSSCLILDEPTSALAVRQAAKVLKHVEAARDAGQAVVLITHNFAQALSVADDIVVLDRGRVVGTFVRGEMSLQDLTDLVSTGV